MASRWTYKLESLGQGKVLLSGSFRPQGTSALESGDTTPAPVKDRGFTVARDDVGKYTVTLLDKWVDLDSSTFGVRTDADDEATVQGGAWDAAAGTLEIKTFVSGSLADLADDPDNRVSFSLVLRSVNGGVGAAS